MATDIPGKDSLADLPTLYGHLMTESNLWLIVPAAGIGQRMQAECPKQYLRIDCRFILDITLSRVLNAAQFSGCMVPLNPSDHWWPTTESSQDKRIQTCIGGAERADSVLAALRALAGQAGDDDWVLVHDAARPCVRQQDIEMLMTRLEDHAVGGLLGVPVADTMKQVDSDNMILKTVERDGLWRALTPQMFRLGPLRDALQQAIASGVMVTDDAAAMEMAGHRSKMVEGHADNIKITRPGDLKLAEFYLQSRETV